MVGFPPFAGFATFKIHNMEKKQQLKYSVVIVSFTNTWAAPTNNLKLFVKGSHMPVLTTIGSFRKIKTFINQCSFPFKFSY